MAIKIEKLSTNIFRKIVKAYKYFGLDKDDIKLITLNSITQHNLDVASEKGFGYRLKHDTIRIKLNISLFVHEDKELVEHRKAIVIELISSIGLCDTKSDLIYEVEESLYYEEKAITKKYSDFVISEEGKMYKLSESDYKFLLDTTHYYIGNKHDDSLIDYFEKAIENGYQRKEKRKFTMQYNTEIYDKIDSYQLFKLKNLKDSDEIYSRWIYSILTDNYRNLSPSMYQFVYVEGITPQYPPLEEMSGTTKIRVKDDEFIITLKEVFVKRDMTEDALFTHVRIPLDKVQFETEEEIEDYLDSVVCDIEETLESNQAISLLMGQGKTRKQTAMADIDFKKFYFLANFDKVKEFKKLMVKEAQAKQAFKDTDGVQKIIDTFNKENNQQMMERRKAVLENITAYLNVLKATGLNIKGQLKDGTPIFTYQVRENVNIHLGLSFAYIEQLGNFKCIYNLSKPEYTLEHIDNFAKESKHLGILLFAQLMNLRKKVDENLLEELSKQYKVKIA